MARHLESLGHEVIAADPNYVPMHATRSRRTKTDRRDARTLMDACETGAWCPACRLSEARRHVRAELALRHALVRTHTRYIALVIMLVRRHGPLSREAVVIDRRQAVKEIRHEPKERRRLRASCLLVAARHRRRVGHARSGTEERRAYVRLGCAPSPLCCATSHSGATSGIVGLTMPALGESGARSRADRPSAPREPSGGPLATEARDRVLHRRESAVRVRMRRWRCLRYRGDLDQTLAF